MTKWFVAARGALILALCATPPALLAQVQAPSAGAEAAALPAQLQDFDAYVVAVR